MCQVVGPCVYFCDNCGVVKNMIIPESLLYKNFNLMKYHSVHEAVSTDIIQFGEKDGETNSADFLTNVMNGHK